MKLLIICFGLISISSCRPGERATNSNSTVSPANQNAKDSAAETNRKGPCVNLNTASAAELITLPGIGEVIAKRIVDYREKRGPFRRPEEIIIIEGFSEKKYLAIAELICV
jgi:competence ComEA-like helix-hairpin-helix protein